MQHLPEAHPTVAFGKIGLLVVNLGTPDSTSWWDIRRYLKEFLSDRRVIEVNPLLWWLILHGPILTFRPSKTAHAYASIWKNDTNESPLRFYTREQARLLAERFTARGDGVRVDYAMRYGTPSIDQKLKELKAQGCTRIALLPLYPQYAASTSATVGDAAFRSLMQMRWQPALRIAEPYYDEPAYIAALAQSVRAHLARLDTPPEVILASFHGLPLRYFKAGDPYHCHCHKTARLLREALGMDAMQLRLTFQSRFGREPWLEPYTDKTVVALAKEGVKRLAIITPGFSSDCVETLEEIAMGVKEQFCDAGGEQFTVIPCLNQTPEHIDLLETLALRALSGWL